jgi:hypothetical protein
MPKKSSLPRRSSSPSSLCSLSSELFSTAVVDPVVEHTVNTLVASEWTPFGRQHAMLICHHRYWHDPGALANGFKGVCAVFVTAAFSFSGTELVGLAATETPNPRKSLPSAIKNTFWRSKFRANKWMAFGINEGNSHAHLHPLDVDPRTQCSLQ